MALSSRSFSLKPAQIAASDALSRLLESSSEKDGEPRDQTRDEHIGQAIRFLRFQLPDGNRRLPESVAQSLPRDRVVNAPADTQKSRRRYGLYFSFSRPASSVHRCIALRILPGFGGSAGP